MFKKARPGRAAKRIVLTCNFKICKRGWIPQTLQACLERLLEEVSTCHGKAGSSLSRFVNSGASLSRLIRPFRWS